MKTLVAPVSYESVKGITSLIPLSHLSLEELVERAGLSEEDLKPHKGMIEWDAYIKLLSAYLTHERSIHDAKSFGTESLSRNGPLRMFVKAARIFVSPAAVFEFIGKVSGRYFFPCIKLRNQRIDERRHLLTIEAPADTVENGEIWFEMLRWHYSAVTHVLGLGWAEVDYKFEGRKASYLIHLPISGTLAFRLKRSLQWLFSYQAALEFMEKQQKAIDLRQSEILELERERAELLNALPIGVLVFHGGQPIYLNERARKLLQLQQENLKPVSTQFAPVLDRELPDGMRLSFQPTEEITREILIHHRLHLNFRGQMAHVVLIGEVDSSGSAREEFQKRLSETSRIAEMGMIAGLNQIAGGIAHEIGNPLAIISGSVDRLRSELQKSERDLAQQNKIIDTIERSSQRISGLVNTILCYTTFGRQKRASGEFRSPSEILKQLSSLFATRAQDSSVRIRMDPSMDALPDRHLGPFGDLIMQAMLPLMQNAFDAVAFHSQREITLGAEWGSEKVSFFVRDSGPGIDPAIQDRIYYPFFSSKAVGGGAGLGLNTALNIARQIRGELDFQTSPRGTTFWLRIPTEQLYSKAH